MKAPGRDVDIIVLGGGFVGSLMSLILARQHRKVVLLERSRHPRFAIGESSTPLANLVLEGLCDQYDLTALRTLSRYGSWKRSFPDLRCGIKRGFTFLHHRPHETFQTFPDHRNELLVAANASEDLADTHWLRADVDHFFIQEAERGGVEVHQEFSVHRIERGPPWTVIGGADDVQFGFRAPYVIDATGGAALLAPYVDAQPAPLRTHSRAIYSHYSGVERFADIAGLDSPDYPYPPDDAALHHVWSDGWMWVLRFDHGVSSVGMMLGPRTAGESGEDIWTARLREFPSIARQMEPAERLRPLSAGGRVQRRWSRTSGTDFAMLPNTAYFVDPLLSTGNAQSMIGVERLAHAFDAWPNRSEIARRLDRYNAQLHADADTVDVMVAGAYRAFGSFRLLISWLLYYFAAAIVSEENRRAGDVSIEDGFLLSHDQEFQERLAGAYGALTDLVESGSMTDTAIDVFTEQVHRDIEPYDRTGLRSPAVTNLHPYA